MGVDGGTGAVGGAGTGGEVAWGTGVGASRGTGRDAGAGRGGARVDNADGPATTQAHIHDANAVNIDQMLDPSHNLGCRPPLRPKNARVVKRRIRCDAEDTYGVEDAEYRSGHMGAMLFIDIAGLPASAV